MAEPPPSPPMDPQRHRHHHHAVPLVELKLDRITYAPVVTGTMAANATKQHDTAAATATTAAPAAEAGRERRRRRGGHLRSLLCRRRRRSSSSAASAAAVRKTRKVILSNVSTTISPHRLTAYMGPSGSGKTSLLTVAAGLVPNPTEDLIGDSSTYVNGERGWVPKRLVGVVWQDDLLLGNLTVRETVSFAARLKTPESVGNDAVEVLVEETLEELGLTGVADSLIGGGVGGGGARGVSGGERKRVAVAVELVARPSVLLLDEPTSGLDATSAKSLIGTLQSLASMGHAVAVVVHQPRTSIYESFDELVLLSRGRMVYGGPAEGARRCLESCPGVMPLPPMTNIADWIMDVVVDDERREGGSALANHWVETEQQQQQQREEEGESLGRRDAAFKNGEESPPPSREKEYEEGGDKKRIRWGVECPQKETDETTIPPSRPTTNRRRRLSSLAELNAEPKFKVSFWTQLSLLIARSMRQQRGERLTRIAALLVSVQIAFSGLFWFRLPDTTAYVYTRISFLFFVIIAQSNGIVVASMTTFSRERALLARERAKKMYGVFPYFVAKTVSDMSNSVLLPMAYGATVYWLVNLRPTADAYMTFLLIFYLTVSTAQSMGLFLSVAIPNQQVALLLAPLVTLMLMILGGFYIPYESMHSVIQWASWLSMARYGFSAFVLNEFSGRDVPCADEDDGGGDVPIAIGGSGDCPLPGEDIIDGMGIDGAIASTWSNVGILCAMQVVLRVASYALLRRTG